MKICWRLSDIQCFFEEGAFRAGFSSISTHRTRISYQAGGAGGGSLFSHSLTYLLTSNPSPTRPLPSGPCPCMMWLAHVPFPYLAHFHSIPESLAFSLTFNLVPSSWALISPPWLIDWLSGTGFWILFFFLIRKYGARSNYGYEVHN